MPTIIVKFIVCLISCSALSVAAREHIDIVGSSTVYEFAAVVAEDFGRGDGVLTPRVESIGSGGGFKRFCAGVGRHFPDIANASRRIKYREWQQCRAHGVAQVIEVNIGFDGIVLATAARNTELALTVADLFLALSRWVPAADGSAKLVLNPYHTWQQVNPQLPNIPIKVYGPPPSSGTREAFVQLVLEAGCDRIVRSQAALAGTQCQQLREDGVYIEVGENDQLTVQRLQLHPTAIGVFGYGVLLKHSSQLFALSINGVSPNAASIGSQRYGLARPLFFYVKADHFGLIPNLANYVEHFLADATSGVLRRYGMVPLPAVKRQQQNQTWRQSSVLSEATFLGGADGS